MTLAQLHLLGWWRKPALPGVNTAPYRSRAAQLDVRVRRG